MSDKVQEFITLDQVTSAGSFLPTLSSQTVPNDYLARFVIMPEETKSVRMSVVVKTSDVVAAMHAWDDRLNRDLDTLKEIVYWQHRLLDYGSSYQAYLLDQITEDDLEAEAAKFAIQPESRSPELIASEIERIHRLISINYTASDYADLFQCDYEDVLAAVEVLSSVELDQTIILPER